MHRADEGPGAYRVERRMREDAKNAFSSRTGFRNERVLLGPHPLPAYLVPHAWTPVR